MNPNDLNDIIQLELERIARKKGHSLADCEVSIVSDQELSITKEGELIDLFILPGPRLYITFIFLGRCFFIEKTNVPLFRDRLERALERLPDMRRTLLNNIKNDSALVLRRDYSRWLKTKLEVVDMLDESFFTTSYSVTVTEKLSGMSLTVSTKSKAELLLAQEDAKKRISRIVQSNEEIAHFRHTLIEMRKDIEAAKKLDLKGNLEKVSIVSGDNDQVKEVREYKSNETKL